MELQDALNKQRAKKTDSIDDYDPSMRESLHTPRDTVLL